MSEDLEKLKSDPQVLDLYLSRGRFTKASSSRYRACCPLGIHDDSTPSFDIYLDDNRWIFKCLGACGQSGSILDFVQKTDGVSFSDAVRIVREAVSPWLQNGPRVDSIFKSVSSDQKQLRTFPEEQYKKLEAAFARNKEAQTWLYKERGIDFPTAQRLRIGFAQKIDGAGGAVSAGGWLSFATFGKGANAGDLVVTSIKYRSIVDKSFTKQPNMGTHLWNLQTVDFLEPVFLVEGEMDACVLEMCGYRAVSLSNAQHKPTPLEKDALLRADYVILAGDTDAPGTEAMTRLWSELGERTYLLKWPPPAKDANDFFRKACSGNISIFRTKIEELTQEAKSRPMADVYSLQEMMISNGQENIIDNPLRFRFPWPEVDRMAILSPGSVIGVVATNTGMGKSTWAIQATLYAARAHGEVVLNYQAELTKEQVTTIVTAHVLRKHRLHLTKEDFQAAAGLLPDVKYYVGRNPTLNTIGPVLDLIEAAIRRLSPTVIVLDNLHFLSRFETDQVKAVENAMQKIKNLSAKYGLKFFVLGQPKKSDQTSKGKSLHITDVRGSASFGDDSDAVFTIHRDIVKNREEDKKNEYDPKTKIRLVKVREKGPGDAEVELVFIGEIATFSAIAYESNTSDLFSRTDQNL